MVFGDRASRSSFYFRPRSTGADRTKMRSYKPLKLYRDRTLITSTRRFDCLNARMSRWPFRVFDRHCSGNVQGAILHDSSNGTSKNSSSRLVERTPNTDNSFRYLSVAFMRYSRAFSPRNHFTNAITHPVTRAVRKTQYYCDTSSNLCSQYRNIS
jgi:hypothetical protein